MQNDRGIPGVYRSGRTLRRRGGARSFGGGGRPRHRSTAAIGSFVYSKDDSGVSYHLAIHLLEVTETLADFPEKKTRRLRWAPLETAVKDVSHPRVRDLLLCSIGPM